MLTDYGCNFVVQREHIMFSEFPARSWRELPRYSSTPTARSKDKPESRSAC